MLILNLSFYFVQDNIIVNCVNIQLICDNNHLRRKENEKGIWQ
uniref:Uncharacterized protein n=1 Tax=Anguilla anguilla TaxID=7936 RepID=A0A0E9Q9G0_ANGAN